MKKRLFVLLALLPLLAAGGGQYTIPGATGAHGPAPVPIIVSTNSAGSIGCEPGTACSDTLASHSFTAGNTIYLFIYAVAPDATVTMGTNSGSGCPTSWTSLGARADSPTFLALYGWIGIVPSNGTCTQTWTNSTSAYGGDQWYEISGTAGLDVATKSAQSGAFTLTSGSASTMANDLAIVDTHPYTNPGSTPSAAGWTSMSWNFVYDQGFYQTVSASGTSPTFTGSGYGSGGAVVGWMVLIKP